MSDNYSIQISLNDATLQALSDQNLALHAFKGVQANVGGGASTVWLTTNNFGETTTISWEEQYGGFVENQQFGTGITVLASDVKAMDLGDILSVDNSGASNINTGGTAGDIIVLNKGNKAWTGGMGQVVVNPATNQGELSPLCAFPLNGHFGITMMPYEKVLLVFESGQTDTGSVVEETTSSTIVITLTGDDVGVPKPVSFDINTGWDANNAGWAEINDNGYTIADKLIHQM